MNSLRQRHPGMPLRCLCELFGKTREGYYAVSRDEMEARIHLENNLERMVREIRLEDPGIGAHKLFLILKDIYGRRMPGRDRFYKLLHRKRLMLAPQRRRHTTNSNHNYRKYKNLIKGYKPDGINKLWVADITYIDTDSGVCYLHLLTDAFSREIIGWTLSESLRAEHTLDALNLALDKFAGYDHPSLIHHSDRGAQYCSELYVKRLRESNISISMTEDGSPTDNAIAERMNGIIKQEWLYRMRRPKDFEEAKELIGRIVSFYNEKRPHRSNRMRTPAQVRSLEET